MTALGAVVLLGSVVPAGVAGGQEDDFTERVGGFHGFSSFETHVQAHVASTVGYLNAFREEDRIIGALSEINGPPANSRNIAGLFQRGEAVTFVYGVIGGGGGERGTLPDPPPGEVGAFYPTDPPEATFEGPVTAVFDRGRERTFDGRAHAAATETPTGKSEASVVHLDVPNYFAVDVASAASHTEPVEGGVAAESISILRGFTAGPLHIESLTSTATAFVSHTEGDPKGVATTVVEGADVNGTPVNITDRGVLVGEQATPGSQAQVNAALLEAGFKEVRLLPSTAAAGSDKQSVAAQAGVLQFVQYDEAFGASNPQGFSGGGFTVGGAEAKIQAKRCNPECPPPLEEPDDIGGVPGLDSGSGSEYSSDSSGPPSAAGEQPFPVDANVSPVPAGVRTEALAGASFDYPLEQPIPGASAPVGSYSSGTTTAAVPPSLAEPAEARARDSARQPAASAASVVAAPNFLKALSLDEKSADWMRDLYLAGGLAAAALLIVPRLVRAFV